MKTLVSISFVMEIDEDDLAELVGRMDDAIVRGIQTGLMPLAREHGVDAVCEALDSIEYYGAVFAPIRRSAGGVP